jgi:hypothetical protein
MNRLPHVSYIQCHGYHRPQTCGLSLVIGLDRHRDSDDEGQHVVYSSSDKCVNVDALNNT